MKVIAGGFDKDHDHIRNVYVSLGAELEGQWAIAQSETGSHQIALTPELARQVATVLEHRARHFLIDERNNA